MIYTYTQLAMLYQIHQMISLYKFTNSIQNSVSGHPPVDPKMNFDTELYHVLILLTQMMMQYHITMVHMTTRISAYRHVFKLN